MGLPKDIKLEDVAWADDSDSQAIEADDDVYYTPTPGEDSGVVAVEPDVLVVGRGKVKNVLREMRQRNHLNS